MFIFLNGGSTICVTLLVHTISRIADCSLDSNPICRYLQYMDIFCRVSPEKQPVAATRLPVLSCFKARKSHSVYKNNFINQVGLYTSSWRSWILQLKQSNHPPTNHPINHVFHIASVVRFGIFSPSRSPPNLVLPCHSPRASVLAPQSWRQLALNCLAWHVLIICW